MNNHFDKILPVFILVIIIFGWIIATKFFSIPSYILPSPFDIIESANKIGSGFWRDFFVTFFESIGGFFLGGITAIFFAIIFVHYKFLEISFLPYAIAMKTIPVVAIAPLLVIWFGAGILPKIILSALICFFPILISSLKGMKEVDPERVDLFKSFGASTFQTFIWLRLPNSLPYLFTSFRIAVVFAVIGAVVAEFASANSGLGFKIMLASFHVDTPSMFLYIISVSLLSMLLYFLVVFIEYVTVPWSFSLRNLIND